MWRAAFRALELDVHLEVAADELAPPLRALTATYGSPEGGEAVRYRVTGGPPCLERGDELRCVVDDERDLAPVFERDLYDQALARSPGLALHAAALGWPGGAWILAGPSGAGKTTLALALLGRGARYLTDELALIDGAASVRGLTRPLTLPDPAAEIPPGAELCPYAIRAEPGAERGTLVHPAPLQREHRAQPLAAVVLIGHGAAGSGLRRISAGELTCRLWSCAQRPTQEARAILLATAGKTPGYELVTGSVEEACAALDSIG